jgi:hypothetical protein
MHGNHVLKEYWYYDGRVDMTSKGYIPILLLALFMLLLLNVFPLALLALYPFKCFQRLVFVFALALVAKFQPYKHKRSNAVDIILLFTIISAYTSSSMYYAEIFMYPRLLNEIIVGIPVLIVFSYLVFFILASVLPNAIQCCKKCKTL